MTPGADGAGLVLALHSHLPWVLHHGRWPHGTDWLCEAVLDCYLPLLGRLRALEDGGVPAPVTLGITPVLAAQLAHPDFRDEFAAYATQRLALDAEAAAALSHDPADAPLARVAGWWGDETRARLRLWDALGGDLLRECARLQRAGRLELLGSAATHAVLPLLAHDASVRLQLAVGRRAHERRFGSVPAGCWLPECAYRPAGPWAPLPGAPAQPWRAGLEAHLVAAGYRYAFVDAHVAGAGAPLDPYRPDASAATGAAWPAVRSPARAYRAGDLAVLVRDPEASRRVWSRGEGYPGDGRYLEFHKRRWPGGTRLWRVTGRDVGLGDKAPYDPVDARLAARAHAQDFAALLERLGDAPGARVTCAPFDTELFGHWWREGPAFLGDLFRELAHRRVRPETASAHLARSAPPEPVALAAGSWGRDGDFGMWTNDAVAWMWPVLWELEGRFWALAARAVAAPALHELLEQAARALLLAQASDWPFMVSTGEVTDYPVRRFLGHAADARQLLDALAGAVQAGAPTRAQLGLARALHARDDCFDDLVPAIAWALAPTPAP